MSAEKKKIQIQIEKIERWSVDAVIPYALNAKVHDPKQIRKLCAGIERWGFTTPILVDKNGTIIAGHGRLAAAKELGMKEVPVSVIRNLSEADVKALRLADNEVVSDDYDFDMLKGSISEIGDVSLLLGVYTEKELDFIGSDLGVSDDSLFVDDMDRVIREQKETMDERAAESKTGQVTLARAFGYKMIPASALPIVNKMIASIERMTGKTGPDALVAYAQLKHEY